MPRSNADVLRQIATASRKFAESLPTSPLRRQPSISSCQFQELPSNDLFLSPQPLTAVLTSLGLDLIHSEKISQAYIQAAVNLRERYEVQYRLGCHTYFQTGYDCSDYTRLQSLLQSATKSLYTRTLKTWTDEIIDKVEARLCGVSCSGMTDNSGSTIRARNRRPFNQNAVPMLEKFFEQNCRPSRLEKHKLASDTNMEYRQINVWFQNRRNRRKKDDKQRSKCEDSSAFPPELHNIVAQVLSEEENGCGSHSSDISSYTLALSSSTPPVGVHHIFNLERPPHAYPCSYPPLCPYNPFPIQDHSRNFATPWIRDSSSRRHCSNLVDIVQLIESFAKMSLGDDSPRRQTCRLDTSKVASAYIHSNAPVGFAAVMPRAPLQALISTTAIDPFLHRTCVPRLQASCKPLPPSPTSRSLDNLSSQPVYSPSKKLIHQRQAASKRPLSSASQSDRFSPSWDASCSSFTPSLRLSAVPSKTLETSQTTTVKLACGDESQDLMHWCRQLTTASCSRTTSPASRRPSPLHLSITPTEVDPHTSSPVHYQPSTASGGSTRRKVAALPRRIPHASSHFRRPTFSGTIEPTCPSSPRSVPTLSRMSSTSSMRSCSSVSSSSSSDCDGPLTPPMLPVNLPTSITSTSVYAFDTQPGPDGLLGEVPVAKTLPTEGLQRDLLESLATGHGKIQQNHKYVNHPSVSG